MKSEYTPNVQGLAPKQTSEPEVNEDCSICGKPILPGEQTCFDRTRLNEDFNRAHTACADARTAKRRKAQGANDFIG